MRPGKIRQTLAVAALATTITTTTTAARAEVPVLTVYTYDSFTSEWGPGPMVEKTFEEICGCDLQFVAPGDGAELLARLRLEGERSPADIVLGLDNNLIAQARESGLFAPHELGARSYDLPVEVTDDTFVPFDWGYFAFVYDKARVANPPKSFRELAASPQDFKIIIQDPRSSTPGLGLLLWIKAAYGDEAEAIWAALAPHVLTVTRGWSEAYGLFLEGEAEMVLSYTTSPAYHLIAEEDDTKAAAIFDEGHYLQVEVAARLAGSDQPELSQRFLDFMLGDTFQSIIPTTNWMYPAVTPSRGLPEGFGTLIHPQRALEFAPDEVPAVRQEALAEWLRALGR